MTARQMMFWHLGTTYITLHCWRLSCFLLMPQGFWIKTVFSKRLQRLWVCLCFLLVFYMVSWLHHPHYAFIWWTVNFSEGDRVVGILYPINPHSGDQRPALPCLTRRLLQNGLNQLVYFSTQYIHILDSHISVSVLQYYTGCSDGQR